MNARPDRASPGSVYGGTSDGRECRHGCYLATKVPVTTRLCRKVGLTVPDGSSGVLTVAPC